MKLVADENIPGIEALFGRYFDEIVRLPGRTMTPAQVADADALVVRSVTRVNRELVEQSKVKFVGTCTIGTDHLDTLALSELGIHWCSAPGCNADSVADYVLAACAVLERPVARQRVAVIGAGNVGSRVIRRFRQMSADVRVVDPFLAEPVVTGHSLEQVFEWAEIICLHTPLTRDGAHPTAGMIDSALVGRCASNTLIISAGRGPVVKNEAVMSRTDIDWVLDVWDHEPSVAIESIEQAKIATAHIAGYANEGKRRGTWMVFNEWARANQKPIADWSVVAGELLPRPTRSDRWQDQILAAYDIRRDDRLFREALTASPADNAIAFDQLRKHYPGRHEFNQFDWTS